MCGLFLLVSCPSDSSVLLKYTSFPLFFFLCLYAQNMYILLFHSQTIKLYLYVTTVHNVTMNMEVHVSQRDIIIMSSEQISKVETGMSNTSFIFNFFSSRYTFSTILMFSLTKYKNFIFQMIYPQVH